MTDTTTGSFVWYELMTTDPQAAIAFYTDVIGWKTQVFGDAAAPKPYTMWLGGQGPLGGVMHLPDEAKAMGAPPHWMSNVTVGDVDAAAAKATKLGGKVYMPPMDIPEIGRVAVIADPQGATIAIFKPLQAMAGHDGSKGGEFTWNELVTSDLDGALGFYGELFGWTKTAEHDMGEMGTYVMYGSGGKTHGGMCKQPPGMQMPPSFLYYVQVDDFDAAFERAKAGGAKVLNGPMPVPTGSRIVQLMDPQGAAFALHGK